MTPQSLLRWDEFDKLDVTRLCPIQFSRLVQVTISVRPRESALASMNEANSTQVQDSSAKLQSLRESLANVIRGKDDVIEQVVIALVAGGSVLLEDVPGVGKTTLAKALAASLDLKFRRVQCTPDLLPADVFGFSVFNPQDGSFSFRPGPIFCNVLLVDEINRASPRTQSALLEAMAEGQVTIEGTRYELEPPFLVIATQNPLGFQGTFPLPESQMDRFLFQLSIEYPNAEDEATMLYDQMESHPLEHVKVTMTIDEIVAAQQQVRQIRVEPSLGDYIVEICRRTRNHEGFRLGVSPRGSLMLFRASQARAYVQGRDYVLPDDVQAMAQYVLPHRIASSKTSTAKREHALQAVERIIQDIDVPV